MWFDHKLHGEISTSLEEFFGRKYQRYDVNVTTRETRSGATRKVCQR